MRRYQMRNCRKGRLPVPCREPITAMFPLLPISRQFRLGICNARHVSKKSLCIIDWRCDILAFADKMNTEHQGETFSEIRHRVSKFWDFSAVSSKNIILSSKSLKLEKCMFLLQSLSLIEWQNLREIYYWCFWKSSVETGLESADLD